jgi:hypothetical protein
MAYWWSVNVNGKTIFYKLSEHLSAYYVKFSERRWKQQTIVESQPQYHPNQRHIQSQSHCASVSSAFLPHTFSGGSSTMVESEFPDTGSIASGLTPILQTEDIVRDNSNKMMQLVENHSIEVDDEPIASSSVIQLENLHTALSTGYAPANYALGLLRP